MYNYYLIRLAIVRFPFLVTLLFLFLFVGGCVGCCVRGSVFLNKTYLFHKSKTLNLWELHVWTLKYVEYVSGSAKLEMLVVLNTNLGHFSLFSTTNFLTSYADFFPDFAAWGQESPDRNDLFPNCLVVLSA